MIQLPLAPVPDGLLLSARLRPVSAWLRGLAGLVVVAALYAGWLLFRHPDLGDGSPAAYLRFATQIILGVCIGALFGYVALTGLPPSHLLPAAGDDWLGDDPALRLTPELRRWLLNLCTRHAAIRELWLLRGPASTSAIARTKWRLLALVDDAGMAAIREDWDIRRPDLHLHLRSLAANHVSLAWGRTSPVSFETWNWELQSDTAAEFQWPASGEQGSGVRLWSR